MAMKKTDLEKQGAKKIVGSMRGAPIPDRFGQGASAVADKTLDRRERRSRDAAAGLVPFACKLSADLQKKLLARAATHDGGVNALVAELLEKGLAS